MSKAKWVICFLLAFVVAAPSYAVELTLGGFPSYMRIRPQFYHNSTFLSTLSQQQAQALGFSDNTDNIVFVDSRLRLTPQLVLSDAVTIRAQVDVMDNMIWGGTGNGALNGGAGNGSAQGSFPNQFIINSSLTPGDRFRGAVLIGVNTQAVDSPQFFNLRMIHLDLVLPDNWGFMRIGRQPFDWGLGILANGGWDPLSDLGFILDRFLYLKSWNIFKGSFTFVFVSDRLQQGNTLVTASGDGWDGGAVAMIYNQGPLTVGGYVFPYIHQTGFASTPPTATNPGGGNSHLNIKRDTLWSGLIDYKDPWFRLVGEVQGEQGEVQLPGGGTAEINASNIIFAARGEVYPGFPAKLIALEGGWAKGRNTAKTNFDGGVIQFNPAYNIDNLLFKHMIPTIYQTEESVGNAFYGRLWGTVKVLDHMTVTPQVLVAWTQNASNPLFATEDNTLHNGNSLSKYLGTELETTVSYEVVPGVNFDLLGSLVISGRGLKQLENDQAVNICNSNANCQALNQNTSGGPKVPYAIQGRVMVYIDQFFKK